MKIEVWTFKHEDEHPAAVQVASATSTVQYSTVQYSTVQYSTVQYSTVQYSTVQYSTVQYSTVQYSTVQYSTVVTSFIAEPTNNCDTDYKPSEEEEKAIKKRLLYHARRLLLSHVPIAVHDVVVTHLQNILQDNI